MHQGIWIVCCELWASDTIGLYFFKANEKKGNFYKKEDIDLVDMWAQLVKTKQPVYIIRFNTLAFFFVGLW